MKKQPPSPYLNKTYHVQSTDDMLQIIKVTSELLEIKYLNKDKPVFQSDIKALKRVVGNGCWKEVEL